VKIHDQLIVSILLVADDIAHVITWSHFKCYYLYINVTCCIYLYYLCSLYSKYGLMHTKKWLISL